MDFKPNDSQGQTRLQNATKLQLAKRQLNSIQEKFKKYKSKSRQHTERRSQDSRMPFQAKNHIYSSNRQDMHPLVPDLKQYFSFMMQKQNESHLDNNHHKNNHHKINSNSKQRLPNKSPNKLEAYDRVLQENEQRSNKRSIQQKLLQQKTQAISSLENFFMTKKQQLEAKISEMEQQKQKAIQDINLLKRNNSEVQSQIQFEKNMIFTDATQIIKDKNKEIQEKIRRKREAIETMKKDVEKAKRRKDQLKQNIQQCLKGNKNIILNQKNCQ